MNKTMLFDNLIFSSPNQFIEYYLLLLSSAKPGRRSHYHVQQQLDTAIAKQLVLWSI